MSLLTKASLAIAGVTAGVLFALFAAAGGDEPLLVAAALWLVVVAVVVLSARSSRRRAVEREAKRLGLSFSPKDPFRTLDLRFHPFVQVARVPGTEGVANVVWGTRAGRAVRAFEYWRAAEDEPVRFSCATVRIPDGWPPLLVRRRSAVSAIREVAGMGRIRFELESFNRTFDVGAADRAWASAVVDQWLMRWLLDTDPALGFQVHRGWLLAWMPRVPPEELERVIATAEGFDDRIPRAARSIYGGGRPARPDLG